MDTKHKLFVEIEFPRLLSDRAQADVKQAVRDLQEALEYLEPKMIRADLVKR
jgi:hypothetical protein